MARNHTRHRLEQVERRLQEQIARKAKRKLRASQEEERGIVFWLGMFGLVGWSVAIPVLAGTALGLWLDARWPGEISWTLSFLFIGFVVGCLHAWYWIREEQNHG